MTNKILETNDDDINFEITYDHIYKIIIIGDSGVGKTSLISKYVKNTFPKNIFPTIAIEFATKIIQIKEGGYIKAQIWDTAGQEKYKSITNFHYRNAVGGLVVYDITRRSTFENAKKWFEDLKNSGDSSCIVALVANKVDLDVNSRDREVPYEEGKEFADQNNMCFYEVSALSGVNVNDAFEDLLQNIYTERRKVSYLKSNKDVNKSIKIEKSTQLIDKIKEKQCC